MIRVKRGWKVLVVLLVMMVAVCLPALASDEAIARADEAIFIANNVWMMVSIFLVFVMHLGFATLESGLTRAKNTVNILFKNFTIVAIGLLTYSILGFNLMYPGDSWIFGSWLGFGGWGISAPEGAAGLIAYAEGHYTYWTDFLFQGMFAATAATIVSGAVAERVHLKGFLWFSLFFVGLVYPFLGSWKWGGGWLDQLGFYDFAGSTLVHSVGGWGALAGVLMLGPRIGKYSGGHSRALRGHSMPLATIGVFILWLGWFGFNGGSVLSADPGAVSYVLVTTSLAAAAGMVSSMFVSDLIQKKPDLSMILNGTLAGLVGITAGADTVSISSAILIGTVAGILVVSAVIFIDSKLHWDDPVGALSVHLIGGIWGTLAVGIFSVNPEHSFLIQLLGVVVYGAVAFPAALMLMLIVKKTCGIRVSEEDEIKGLDISEHGMEAYGGFQIFATE